MNWKIEWRGQAWTDDDLTGQHLAALALISGDDRFESLDLNPEDVVGYPSEGYMRLMLMLSAFVSVAACNGIDDPDEAHDATTRVLGEVQEATADEILGAISYN